MRVAYDLVPYPKFSFSPSNNQWHGCGIQHDHIVANSNTLGA